MQKIDLHGYTLEEGLAQADKFIDGCFARKVREVEIITGNGVIYNSVLELARNHELVRSVKNDGILGLAYQGRIGLELED